VKTGKNSRVVPKETESKRMKRLLLYAPAAVALSILSIAPAMASCNVYYTVSTGSGVVGCLAVGSGASQQRWGCNVSGGLNPTCGYTALAGDLFVSGSTIAGGGSGWKCTSTLNTDVANTGWQAVSWDPFTSYSTSAECVSILDTNCNIVADTSGCRCKIGYYGTGTSCTKCSSLTTINNASISVTNATTAGPGTTSASGCFIPAGGPLTIANGDTFKWNDCPYQ